MKLLIKILIAATVAAIVAVGFGCGSEPESEIILQEENVITVGFSQLGAESDWRSENTKSMIEAFDNAEGFRLIIEDGQQKQSNQIMAIRTFIQQGVDYIVLAPVTESGWDTVLTEAKDAGIPVIIVDRQVKVEDESLFTCWVGSDFELEGMKAVKWLYDYVKRKGIDPSQVNIVNIQGTIGASAQIGRSAALKKGVDDYGFNLLAAASADFTQTRGRELMQRYLHLYPDLNVVYCENDNSAFGAIEAIEAAGKKAGSDIENGEIMVISFDGVTREAMERVQADKISLISECNPMHGPRVHVIIEQLEKGKEIQKYMYVSEGVYVNDGVFSFIYMGGKQYGLTVVDEEYINTRFPDIKNK